MKLMLGIGCDRGTSQRTLEQAITLALSQISADSSGVAGMASIDRKSDEAAILDLARTRDWSLHFYPAQELAEVKVPNPSEVVMKYMGTPAVSEAAAILAANTDQRNLLVEKFKFKGDDGKHATVSVVRMNND